jgi:hypothetical protein
VAELPPIIYYFGEPYFFFIPSVELRQYKIRLIKYFSTIDVNFSDASAVHSNIFFLSLSFMMAPSLIETN